MDTENAVQLAQEDLAGLYASVSAHVRGGLSRGDRAVLVDGNAYSPSWRALRGGGAVWEASSEIGYGAQPDEQAMLDLIDAYVETLDAGTEDDRWGSDCFLFWEDGLLFVQRHY